MNQKRVFVAGATGVLGRRVVELLESQVGRALLGATNTTTCNNWTSNADGRAMVGHLRIPLRGVQPRLHSQRVPVRARGGEAEVPGVQEQESRTGFHSREALEKWVALETARAAPVRPAAKNNVGHGGPVFRHP